MKLEFFDKIEKTIHIFNDMQPIYNDVCETLESFFEGLMIELEQSIINIRSRVKRPKSIKEKIIRNKLYKKFDSPERIIESLPDIVGVMIFCRFIYEEEIILEKLKGFFTKKGEDGWYYNSVLENVPIYLDLDAKQPQKQKNGFNIYRIDGYYYSYGEKVNFELQIKSLVHSFWSDIEHEIIYKNNNYLIIDDFMKEMLSSIYRNMESMDNQIALIYNELNDETRKNDLKQINFTKIMLAKSINDLFITKMHENLGFTIDFKKACDIISQYIFVKNEILENEMSNRTLLEIMERINSIQDIDMDFETPIIFETKFQPKSRFGEILGEKLLELINRDFEWNIFFKILFAIEPGSNVEDFRKFLYIIKTRYSAANLYKNLFEKFGEKDAYYIKDEILIIVANALAEDGSIKIVYEEKFEEICILIGKAVNNISNQIADINDWEDRKAEFKLKLKENIITALR